MKFTSKIGLTLLSMCLASAAQAGPVTPALSFWGTDGWTQFADDDGIVAPGIGGQAFDTEYLYYKQVGNVVSIGLQTGYDVVDGEQTYSTQPKKYYAGDLALSFDGNAVLGNGSTYEYGIDFGLYTEDYYGNKVGGPTGLNSAGLYSVSSWSNGVYTGHTASNPFAIQNGTLVSSLFTNDSGYDAPYNTYWRTVSFDITGLGSDLDVHWTMSCGNDAIDGSFSVAVPETSTYAIFLAGLLFMGGAAVRKKQIAAGNLV